MFTNKMLGVLGALILPAMTFGSAISVVPSTNTVNIGDLLTLTIQGSGFPVGVDAGGLNISWNPSILKLGPSAFTLDPVWIPPSTTGTAGSGTLSNIDFFDAAPPNKALFTIGTIQFQALAAGASSISLTEDSLNPFAGGGAEITGITFANGSVTVNGPTGTTGSTTPEPQSTALVAGALAFVVFGYRQRRQRRTQA